MKRIFSNVVIVSCSFLVLMIMIAGCESEADRKQRCRDQFNRCMEPCRQQRNEFMNQHHTELLACSDSLITAMKTCDANHAPASKPWSQCMISATQAYQQCRDSSEVSYNRNLLEVELCEMECELEYIGCLQGL